MVTKKKQPYVPARREMIDGEPRWMCNVVDGCDGVAIQQASPDVLPSCAGECGVAGAELKQNVEQRRAELDAANTREESIRIAARAAKESRDRAAVEAAQLAAQGIHVPPLPPREPHELLDELELRAIAERRRILGAEIEAIEAEHARVVADHTHPLFACEKHMGRLPQ